MNIDKWIAEEIWIQGKSCSQVAKDSGVCTWTIKHYLNGTRGIYFKSLEAVVNGLGYELVVRKKGKR